LQSEKAAIYKDQHTIDMDIVSGDVYHNFSPIIRFIASKSSYDITKNNILFHRINIEFLSKPKFYLKSELLMLDPDQGLLIGYKQNKINTNFLEITGDYLHLNLISKKIKIQKHAKAVFYPEYYRDL
jgi:hypothetical protein